MRKSFSFVKDQYVSFLGKTVSNFVISLDFELFRYVPDVHTIGLYSRNIVGACAAIPLLLRLLNRYHIHAGRATVGMLLCRDFELQYLRARVFRGAK